MVYVGVRSTSGACITRPVAPKRVPYVYLGPAEEEGLQALAAEGVEVSARDLPGSRAVDLKALLG